MSQSETTTVQAEQNEANKSPEHTPAPAPAVKTKHVKLSPDIVKHIEHSTVEINRINADIQEKVNAFVAGAMAGSDLSLTYRDINNDKEVIFIINE